MHATTDEWIKREVVEHLAWDPDVDGARVAVTVAGARVRLSGSVPTVAARRRAVLDAAVVHGVVDVDDRLEVRPEGPAADLDDELLQASSLAALREAPTVPYHGVGVTVRGQTALVEGTVACLEHRVRAEEAVAGVPGIESIVNRVRVVPPEPVADEEIEQQVRGHLERHARLGPQAVEVDVERGRVRLRGKVATRLGQFECQELVELVPGVTGVVSVLQVA